MAMRMEIDQNEIEAALRKHLESQIVNLGDKQVTFAFSSKRVGESRISAEVTIAARNEKIEHVGSAVTPALTVVPTTPAAEVVEAAEEVAEETSDAEAPTTETKSLFG